VKFIKQLIAVFALLFATQVHAQSLYDSAVTMLKPPQPTQSGNKIEVMEFFFYGCSHCSKLNPYMRTFEKNMPKDVELKYVPAIFNPGWEAMARTFFALEAMGQREKLHDALFDAWNSGQDLMDEASVTAFLSKKGVDTKKFHDAYNSFSMQSQVVRAKQMGQIYGIRGTPTLIVDGKYAITGVGPADLITVLNEVLAKVRKEHMARK